MARKSSSVPLVSEQGQGTPVKHYGFAIIPRIVIRGEKYKGMSLIERGLYQGLKDICGDDGECFYTYRNLAKELNTSISTLSRYIPVLVNKWGLITAEKKCRGNGTNNHEIFHIRMVNIWEENDALYKPQDCFNEKQNFVSDRNNYKDVVTSVSDRNNFVSDRNSIKLTQAQDCFYLNDRMISINNTLSEEDNTRVVANATDDSPIFSFPVVDSETTQVSDETFKVAVLDDWRVHRPSQKITTSSQALEQILNRLSASSPELSTLVVDTPTENVENVRPTRQDDVQTEQASERRIADETTRTDTPKSPDASGTDAPPSEKPARPARPPRTPKPEDETVKVRVEKVFAYFDTLLQETTGKPEAKYARTRKAYREIKDTLLPCAPTEQRLRKVYMKLWKTPPNAKSTFVWKEHMKIDLICGQYENLMIAFDAEEQKEVKKQETKQAMETVIANSSLMAQQEEDYVFDINRMRGSSHRGRRSAS